MKTLATVFAYKRPRALELCLKSISNQSQQVDELFIIDDGSGLSAKGFDVASVVAKTADMLPVNFLRKPVNVGFSDSACIALNRARKLNPKLLFFIEGDYVYRPDAFASIVDVFENTEQGKMALGISGYDHPAFYSEDCVEKVFPYGMIAQVGEDNVNRAALYDPVKVAGARGEYYVELVSNTCWTSYLNWRLITEISEEFPQLQRFLDLACNPQDDPIYRDSGKYKAQRVVDDGMLSHAVSLFWNRWAIKHGINRSKFGAWLNIKPSVANHISGGGINNSEQEELTSNANSPSWVEP